LNPLRALMTLWQASLLKPLSLSFLDDSIEERYFSTFSINLFVKYCMSTPPCHQRNTFLKNLPKVVNPHPKGLVLQIHPSLAIIHLPLLALHPHMLFPRHPLSPIPTFPSVTWILKTKEAHKPLDITKIPKSPHKLPKEFKEWLLIFSGEDLTAPEDHLYLFLCSLESYDQHEDILMKIFTYTFVGRAKD
jgi:hypothetical protein